MLCRKLGWRTRAAVTVSSWSRLWSPRVAKRMIAATATIAVRTSAGRCSRPSTRSRSTRLSMGRARVGAAQSRGDRGVALGDPVGKEVHAVGGVEVAGRGSRRAVVAVLPDDPLPLRVDQDDAVVVVVV